MWGDAEQPAKEGKTHFRSFGSQALSRGERGDQDWGRISAQKMLVATLIKREAVLVLERG